MSHPHRARQGPTGGANVTIYSPVTKPRGSDYEWITFETLSGHGRVAVVRSVSSGAGGAILALR